MFVKIIDRMKRISILFLTLFAGILLSAQEVSPQRPSIPDNSVSVLDFGAVPDGVTLNTEAFAKAVAAIGKKGGGRIVVPAGIYLSGKIVLKDCMDLHLEEGAVLLLSPDKKDSWDGKSVKPFITASKRHDVSISGSGIIDGNGQWWRPVKRSKVSDVEWKSFLEKGGTVTEDGSLWYPFNLKNYENIAADYKAQERFRTHLIRFTDCSKVLVTGVTLQNSPKFHLVPQRCEDVTIEGITVRCPWNAQNGDGIDIMQCRNVLIAGCTVDVGDDGICLKGGAGAKALKDGPCKNILIENNTVFHAHGGFVIGSEFSGGMEDITVRNCVFSGTDTGLRFKSAPERGGKCSNIRISNIVMTDIKDEAIVFQTDYADRPAGHDDNQAADTQNFLPDFTDIIIENVTCRGCTTAIKAKGPLSQIHGITVRNSTIFYNDKGIDMSHPEAITLDNVKLMTY